MLRLALAALPLLMLPGCGETAAGGTEGLVLSPDGGDTYEFTDGKAECGFSDDGEGDVEVVRLTAPADFERVRGGRLDPFLYVEVIPGVEGRHEFPLEASFGDEGPSDVEVFGVDSDGRNELSGKVEDASGYLTIIEATCDPEPRLAFTIDATLGSEFFKGRNVEIQGGLEAGG